MFEVRGIKSTILQNLPRKPISTSLTLTISPASVFVPSPDSHYLMSHLLSPHAPSIISSHLHLSHTHTHTHRHFILFTFSTLSNYGLSLKHIAARLYLSASFLLLLTLSHTHVHEHTPAPLCTFLTFSISSSLYFFHPSFLRFYLKASSESLMTPHVLTFFFSPLPFKVEHVDGFHHAHSLCLAPEPPPQVSLVPDE